MKRKCQYVRNYRRHLWVHHWNGWWTRPYSPTVPVKSRMCDVCRMKQRWNGKRWVMYGYEIKYEPKNKNRF
jgi:hypothetical protein